jgi:hypothetical protein
MKVHWDGKTERFVDQGLGVEEAIRLKRSFPDVEVSIEYDSGRVDTLNLVADGFCPEHVIFGRSEGHLAFSVRDGSVYEYFWRKDSVGLDCGDDQVYRANAKNPLYFETRYRQGADWVCSVAHAKRYPDIYGFLFEN